MIDLDGTPNKGRLGANAILGVSLAGGEGGRRGGRAAALALPGRRGGARAARADDERAERRRARRQQGGLPGVHGRARSGRRASPRALRIGAEVFHALKRTLHDAGPRHGRRATRAASRPTSTPTRPRWRCWSPGSRPPATRPATTWRSRSIRRPARSSRAARTCSSTRAGAAHARGDGRLLGRHLVPLPGALDRGRHGRGGLGRLEAR